MRTKKHIHHTCATALTALAFIASATAQSFEVGTNAVNAGIGLGGSRYSYVVSGNDHYSVSPTLSLSYERGVTELGPGVLGIGGFFARKSVHYEDVNSYAYSNTTYNYDQRWSNMVIGLRGAWHYNEWHGSDRFDIYAGLMLGYNVGSYKNKSTKTVNGVTTAYDYSYSGSSSFVTWSTYLGMRYFFTEKVGAYLELGYGMTAANLGLALKF
jgi:hypothetical protein